VNRDASPREKLAQFLDAGSEATLEKLSNHVGGTRRHVRRLLEELEGKGWSIQERWEEGTKHFSLAPQSRSIPTEFFLSKPVGPDSACQPPLSSWPLLLRYFPMRYCLRGIVCRENTKLIEATALP
jgi:hypothetical protein